MNATATPLADFAAWLADAQKRALDGMHTTTGSTFSDHASNFSMLSNATYVLAQFELGNTTDERA